MISAILHLPARALVSPQDFGMKLLTWDVGMRMFTGKPSGTGTNNISKSLKMDLKYLIKVSGEIALRIWFLSYNMCVLVAQSCPTLCDPMDCSPPGSSVHGILQAGTLEWVAISSYRKSSQPRDGICIPDTAGGFFTTELPGTPPRCLLLFLCILYCAFPSSELNLLSPFIFN